MRTLVDYNLEPECSSLRPITKYSHLPCFQILSLIPFILIYESLVPADKNVKTRYPRRREIPEESQSCPPPLVPHRHAMGTRQSLHPHPLSHTQSKSKKKREEATRVHMLLDSTLMRLYPNHVISVEYNLRAITYPFHILKYHSNT